MLETLQIINLIVVITVGIFGLLLTFSKPIRDRLFAHKEIKDAEENESRDRRETDKCLIRDRLVTLYYSHREFCELKQYEFENASKLYNQYQKLGGNSFVDKLWEEMLEWSITR